MRIRCDFWTISAYDFVVLFYFFWYISSACFWVGIVIGMPNAPISVLPWTAGGCQVFEVLIKTVGTSGVDFLVVVPLTLPL